MLKPRTAGFWSAQVRKQRAAPARPSLHSSPGDPERRLTAWVPPCSRSLQRKFGTARGKASASLAKQLEPIARSGVSHIAMDTQNVIGRWCGARYGCGLAYASRGPTVFDGGAGFAGLRGRPPPSPQGGADRRLPRGPAAPGNVARSTQVLPKNKINSEKENRRCLRESEGSWA
jgi:hypothetical protein